jgi:hypothetical protein
VVDLDDPGERALLERIAARLEEADLTGLPQGTRGFLEEVRRRDGVGFIEPYLPVRLVVVAWPAPALPDVPEPALLCATVTRKYAVLAWVARYVLWSRAHEDPATRTESHGDTTITLLPSPHGEAGIAVLENHFLLASRAADLRAAIDRLQDPAPPAVPSPAVGALREAVREEDEDLWGFRSASSEELLQAWRRAAGPSADPRIAGAVSRVRALAFSADVVSSDRLRGKLAFRVEGADRGGDDADALAGAIRALLEPAGIRLEVEEPPQRLGEDVLLLSGRLEGLDAALDALVERTLDAAGEGPPR